LSSIVYWLLSVNILFIKYLTNLIRTKSDIREQAFTEMWKKKFASC